MCCSLVWSSPPPPPPPPPPSCAYSYMLCLSTHAIWHTCWQKKGRAGNAGFVFLISLFLRLHRTSILLYDRLIEVLFAIIWFAEPTVVPAKRVDLGGGGGGELGDLCHFCTLKMIVHDYHNMQHRTAIPCGHTPNHTRINRLQGAKLTIEMRETGRVITSNLK